MMARWSADLFGAIARRFAPVSVSAPPSIPVPAIQPDDVLSSATSILKSLTSDAMLARVNELVAIDPNWYVLLYLLGPDRLIEYAHAVCSRDPQLKLSAAAIPPESLRAKVAAPQEPLFLWTGATDIEFFLKLFEKHEPGMLQPAVLDFGCGCGRLARFFDQTQRYRLSASDVNKELVDWCRENLRNVDTRLNGVLPPLPFADESFDCAYSLSIFTHLPDHLAVRWLREVARVMKPGGIFLVTTHGDVALKIIEVSAERQALFSITAHETANLARQLDDEKFIFLPYAQNVLTFAQAGDEYGNCFTHPEHVEQSWCPQGWQVLEYLPGGLRGWQDVFVLKKLSSA